MPHESMFTSSSPSCASCGDSTPCVGSESPVNELVCDKGRLTPDIWDIGGWTIITPAASYKLILLVAANCWEVLRGDRLRVLACIRAISFSSMRNEGRSNSCCLSGIKEGFYIKNIFYMSKMYFVLPKNVEQMYSEIWLPDRLDSLKWDSSLLSMRLN